MMRKHLLLSPKQISKFTRSGKTKPTHNACYLKKTSRMLFLRYHNAQLSSLLCDSAKLPNLKKDQKLLANARASIGEDLL